MLCEKCHQREARVHITRIIDGAMTKGDLCPQCYKEEIAAMAELPGMDVASFEEIAQLEDMLSDQPRFCPEAYMFVQEMFLIVSRQWLGTLGEIFDEAASPQELAEKPGTNLPERDLPMPEPLEMVRTFLVTYRKLAIDRFGTEAKSMLANWGIRTCDDVASLARPFIRGFGGSPDVYRKAFRDCGHDFADVIWEADAPSVQKDGPAIVTHGIKPNSTPPDFLSWGLKAKLEEIVAADSRYAIEAYLIVSEAVSIACAGSRAESVHTQPRSPHHVPAQEVLAAFRQLAQTRFGTQAKRVLGEFGVKRCEDIGDIVFNLVGAGLLGNRPEDRKEDFHGGYSFDEAFPES